MAKTTTFTRARVISALKPIYSQVISGEKFIEKFGAEDKAVREKRETLEWLMNAFGIEEDELQGSL